MMNRHFIFALCAVLGFSVSGVSMAQSTPADKEAAAKAAKAEAEAAAKAAPVTEAAPAAAPDAEPPPAE